MTAVNIFLRPDAVELWTDGALHGPAGLVGSGGKVILLSHLRAAITFRGQEEWAVILFHHARDQIESFDALVTLFDRIVDGTEAQMGAQLALSPAHADGFEMYLAGWSEEHDEPQAWVKPRGEPLTRIHGGVLSPMDDAFAAKLRGAGLMPSAGKVLQPLEIMRAQQEWYAPAVGCFCERTTIAREGVAASVVERWS